MTEENYTRYEKARLIGARALQVSLGAPLMVEASARDEAIDIAKRELEADELPLTVKRSEKRGLPRFPKV
ncbi:MAG: DNA-directed RNA polymerase subunit K [Methanonatronarchaeales archaeon]|nr:DNA-directed RNA polymerase subunit K [Methanonatronarchaeales archaeon]